MKHHRIIHASVKIPGVKNPKGGNNLQLKLTMQDPKEFVNYELYVKYVSNVRDLLSNPPYNFYEWPSVLQMIQDSLHYNVKNAGLRLEEEIELTQEFLRDVQSFIGFLPFRCAFGFNVVKSKNNIPIITAQYRTDVSDFSKIEIADIDHFESIMKHDFFSNEEICAALYCLIYDFERPCIDLQIEDLATQSLKRQFAEEAKIRLAEHDYLYS